MANEPTEEKINREVIYVYEPITSKKVLDYDAQELRRKNAEFKKSLCGWMPEVGKSCSSFFKNEKERNFMQVHEGKEVKYDEAKATIEKLYQEYLESLPPLFEEGVQKVKEKTPNAHVLTVKLIDANGSYQSVKNEQYESDYILEDSFSGEFSEESYNEAIAEAKQVGLYDDFDIKNLFDQRNPQKQNKMTGRKIKIEMTRELNESLDVAFSLKAAGFGMDGSYKEILETQRNVLFELEIEF
ncbi:MAG: hypothetical protein IJ530_15955 [Treponema sp.]|uniref:hypothetical protein n=1 Tax=Treponema sp. TaxID=166 RepID=UPI0025E59CD2|nr:hypothetical protein [Treponema sp.]MBQ8681227.1 hypothetical protein [Treponema sp.]MBR1403129.1 hypothetical protein [Treponema sp.]